MTENLNDNQIAEKILSSKKHLFEELVDRYKNKVMSVVCRFIGNREEAEDAAQEAFIKAFKYLKSFNLKGKFSSWIFKIATNCAYDRLSKIRKHRFESLDEVREDKKLREIEDNKPTPEESLLDKEKGIRLQQALEKLPDHFREVLILRFMQDLSYNEISEITETPLASVKVNIHRGKARLLKIYKEMESIE